MSQSSSQWYVQHSSGEHGPLSIEELWRQVQQGQLSPESLVRAVDQTRWQTAREALTAQGYAVPQEGNPYATPVAPVSGELASFSGGIPPEVLKPLAQTRPWVMFLAILGFIATAFAGIGILLGLAGAAFLSPRSSPVEGMLLAGVYFVVALIYGFLSWYLLSYARGIGELHATGRVDALVRALAAQRSFWRLLGIIVLVVLCVYALLCVVGLVGVALGVGTR